MILDFSESARWDESNAIKKAVSTINIEKFRLNSQSCNYADALQNKFNQQKKKHISQTVDTKKEL